MNCNNVNEYLRSMRDASKPHLCNPDSIYHGINGHTRLAHEIGYALHDFNQKEQEEIIKSSYSVIYVSATNLKPLMDAKDWNMHLREGFDKKRMSNKIVIGIDQSYKRTGITVLCDKEIVTIEYLPGEKLSHAVFRWNIRNKLDAILSRLLLDNETKQSDIMIIMERIRLMSDGNLSQKYIQATGALCGAIIEVGELYDIPVYSVDTRAWKSAIVGTSKPMCNKYGIDPKKYPTILYMRQEGLLRHIIEPYEGRATKGIITVRKGSERFRARVIDDMADSYCIAMYGYLPENKQKLQREEF